ncbi:MAG TPA: DUF1841 family protein [Gammaproteobacteria bacterium]|nr:DUF1841 family protein [Gammaproteobacteria bacterium]
MFLGEDRESYRKAFAEAWRKARAGEPLEPVERIVADVVAEHPEYHRVIERGDQTLQREYLPETGETNPFLHMGLHIALREQVSADRPAGVRGIHASLARVLGGRTEAEHRMMDCLAETLWQAQRQGTMPDERAYLQCLEELERKLGAPPGRG